MATAVLYTLHPNTILALGTIETYSAGTATPLATYKDNAQAVAHATTISLDAYGLPPGGSMWLASESSYKLIFKNSGGTVIQTIDNVEPGGNIFTAGLQLGGNLDVDGNEITSNATNTNIVINPASTGVTTIHDLQAATNIDMNGFNHLYDDATGILDDSANEQLIFQKTTSAVNYIEITNAATGNGPLIQAGGSDSGIDIKLVHKGGSTSGSTIIGSTSNSLSNSPVVVYAIGDGGGVRDYSMHIYNNVGFYISDSSGSTLQFKVTQGIAEIGPGVSADGGELRVYEASSNGSNYVALKAPANITANRTTLLPTTQSAANSFLMASDTSQTTTWSNNITGGVLLPSGTDAQRSAVTGTLRYNTTSNCLEYYNGSSWIQLTTGT